MDSGRLKRAHEIFAEALRRDPQERYDFIDVACADQPELHASVAALLEQHVAAGQPTEAPGHVRQARSRPPAKANESPGSDMVGPYVIRQELGRGGMGVVYLADDTRLMRRVALKKVSSEIGREKTSRERLRREAQAAAGLSHPGIATVYALEEFGGELFLVCEYVAGQSLRKLLADGPLSIARLLEIATQIARTLAVGARRGSRPP